MRVTDSSIIVLFVTICITSCNHAYKEYDKKSFSNMVWKYGQEISFNPKIDDTSKSYALTLGLRHHYAIPLGFVNVMVKMISPSGKETSKEYQLVMKDSANNYFSKCGGDTCDLEVVVDEITFAEQGDYTFIVTQVMENQHIVGIMEVGLIIDPK